MNNIDFLDDYFKDYMNLLREDQLFEELIAAKKLFKDTKKSGKKVMFCGNGASAAIASHVALDFTKQAGIESMAFNDAALITAFVNDFGYENWVAKAVEFYGKTGDLLVLISSSGQSKNILNAANVRKKMNISLVTFTGFGFDNPPLASLGDINFCVDSRSYNIIENIHQIWLLSICDLIIGKKEYTVS